MKIVYSVELRHELTPRGHLDTNDEEGVMGRKPYEASYWLCVWSGVEHLCVNVSRQLGNQEKGEAYALLSHSFHLLNATGDHFNIHSMCNIYSRHVYITPALSVFVLWIQVYLPTVVLR